MKSNRRFVEWNGMKYKNKRKKKKERMKRVLNCLDIYYKKCRNRKIEEENKEIWGKSNK